jgi:tetratricopeptide (TPR) repeat protein
VMPADAEASGIRPLTPVESRAIDRAGAVLNAGRRADGFRILDSLLAVASARGDTALGYRASAAAAGLHAWADEAQQADSILRPIFGRIEACGDTAFYLGTAVWYAKALLDLVRTAEAESIYRHMVPIAARSGNADREGWARTGLAYIALAAGRNLEARDGYAAAEKLLRECGDRFGELEALTGLGRAYMQMGETYRAEDCFTDVRERARRYGMPRNEASALNNLGASEFARGDPAAALRMFRAAWKIRDAVGNRRETTIPAGNVANALAALGRYDEAAAVLDSLSRVCRAEGFVDYEATALLDLGQLWLDAGRPLRAQRMFQRVIDLGEGIPIMSRAAAYLGLADVLERLEGPAKALEFLEGGACAHLRRAEPADDAVAYDARRAQLLLEVGRPDAAAILAEAAAPEASRQRRAELEVALLTTAARARLESGDHRAAISDLSRATEAWESRRRRPSDPEWRELWADGMQLTSTLIQALLTDPAQPSDRARMQAAFEAAQRFKARGLAERIEGKASQPSGQPSISLDHVQQDLLHPHELLLDAFVGPDSSFVFAVTRDRCVLIRLPGEKVLAEKIEVLNELLSVPQPGDATERVAILGQVAGNFAELLLGSIRELVADAHCILFSPDGPLHALPLDLLCPAANRSQRTEWPGEPRVLARVPSVAYLARLRGQEPDATGPDPGIVLCGGVNAAGQVLAGAEAEARELRRRFRNFATQRSEIDSAAAASVDWLAGYRILHFAAHMELNEAYPWRSGILMSSPDAPSGTRLLLAERIAAIRLGARLVFISGCESARGRVIRGEGIQGLSTAFLAAGTQAVVATLWPVEDLAAAQFVSFFYDSAAGGRTAGEALREAKLRMARSGPYADPSHWAGFVLIGEPGTRVELRSRRLRPAVARVAGPAMLSVGLLGLIAGCGVRLPRRRRL